MGIEKEKKRIIKLYELYGFQYEEDNENILVFTYTNGYFFNAELICFVENEAMMENIKERYEQVGYSVRSIQFESYNKTHEVLFKGFFGLNNINKKLIRDYDRFCDLQSKKLYEASYQYIQPAYTWENRQVKTELSDKIIKQLFNEGPQLIILEAAAGYGKTCTSYEIIKKIANGEYGCAPIFTELSKNRKAALFRYVLLDEIDKKFTALSSELVISEIKNGLVPLIIDGFDELISRSNKEMNLLDSVDEDSKTMLDTISELYRDRATTKIILTSRKSAIFTGELFKEWIENNLPGVTITRVSLAEPTVKDWLGYEKTKYLEQQKIPFASVVNPILLAFMKSMPFDIFKIKCGDVESVIKYYFSSLLVRERERQSLQLNVSEQYNIMKELAENFLEFDISSEEISFIKQLFIEIIHEDYKTYNERYISAEERPSEEEFAAKLANHALLDRVSSQKNDIGFINDFIFGIFLGDRIIENNSILDKADGKYIELAGTAYASRSDENKSKLFSKISAYINKLNYEQQLDIELKLTNTIQRDYANHFFSNRFFNGEIYFDGTFNFSNCTFCNCTFKECSIMTSSFYKCNFYECNFYDLQVINDLNKNQELIFGENCVGHEEFSEKSKYVEQDINDFSENYEERILKIFWGTGGRYSKCKLPESFLLNRYNKEENNGFTEGLECLKKQDLIFKHGHYWILNKEKFSKIKEILKV